MKIICTQENLIKGLNIVSHIAGKNISLPILNNILIRAENSQVNFISTNLDIGIKTQIRGKVEESGELTVQARLFTEYANLLGPSNVELIKQTDSLRVVSEGRESLIKGQEAEDYPIIPDMSGVVGIKLGVEKFKNALNQVIFSASYDDVRLELSGVYFNFNKNELYLVATDSYRLAEKRIIIDRKEEGEMAKIIPLKVLQEILRIVDDGSKEIEMGFSDNQVVFRFEGTVIISRLIEGNYPDYKEIIPKEKKTKVVCDKNELIKIVKLVSLFTKTGINDVLLEFNKSGEIKVSAANVNLGESKSTLRAEVGGENNSVVFNYKYLLDGLQNLKSKQVVIEMKGSDAPVLLKPDGDKTYLYLVMPIRK